MLRSSLLTTSLLIVTIVANGQSPSDIYLFDVDLDKGKVSNMISVSNRKAGYDNQPHFSADGQRLYFTRFTGGQSDIYYYDLKLKVVREFSYLEESEYSPKSTPDGKFVSVVRLGNSAPQLWKVPLKGGEGVTIPGIFPVGNHTWIDNDNLAVLALGSPPSLYHVNLVTGEYKKIIESVGKSLSSSGGQVYFVHKFSEMSWWIKKFDPSTGVVDIVLPTIEGQEAFFVTSSGMILMGDGQTIFYERKGKWKKLIQFESSDFTDFDRIAVSADEKKLAIASKN